MLVDRLHGLVDELLEVAFPECFYASRMAKFVYIVSECFRGRPPSHGHGIVADRGHVHTAVHEAILQQKLNTVVNENVELNKRVALIEGKAQARYAHFIRPRREACKDRLVVK